ncbi:DUF222 domain-containing protein [Kribbella sp. NPDC058245]|uniref:HNH endonuclease signature motif containing protein n=1 Tax=Kribbella sp. NPDC058245 TaxID=3346399 RepID=UPI0036EA34E7
MEILAMRPVCMQSGSELLTNLDNVHAAKALLNTYELQLTGRLDETGTAQELGARDTVELVSQRYRLNPGDVRKDLKYSAALGKYPAVVDALPDPTDPSHPAVLDPALAKVIVTTLEKAPATVPVDVLEVAEEQMINAARISNPRELTKFGQEVLARLDTDGAEPAEDEARAKESLRVRQVDGGVKFSGFVAGASGEQLLTQIHAGAKPHKTIDGERDPRPLEVRQVDAFKGVLDAAAGNPDHPGVPHITVTIDFNDLKTHLGTVTEAAATNTPAPTPTGGTGSTSAPGPAGTPSTTDSTKAAGTSDAVGMAGTTGAVGSPDGVGAVRSSGAVGEMVFGGNLSASAVRLLACDAAILPIVLGGDSQPLDVGTEQRFVNRYIRRALNKRDKGCVVCKAPPWMCHAHHLIHWADGGPTSLHNLALLCAAHHRAVHNGQWAISITGGQVHVTRPDWADPPATNPADLAALLAWATPARNPAEADTPNPGTTSTSHAHTGTNVANATFDPWAGTATATADSPSASANGASGSAGSNPNGASTSAGSSADWPDISTNPASWQHDALPSTRRPHDPGRAASREALQTRLLLPAPSDCDPWATNPAPASGL